MTPNRRRVIKARKALSLYDLKTEQKCALIDLLADLRHYCDARGWDFGNEDRIAYQHYIAENKSHVSHFYYREAKFEARKRRQERRWAGLTKEMEAST